jgi:hypothetical protein
MWVSGRGREGEGEVGRGRVAHLDGSERAMDDAFQHLTVAEAFMELFLCWWPAMVYVMMMREV